MKQRIIYFIVCLVAMCSLAMLKSSCFAQKEPFTDANDISGAWKLLPVLASDTASGKPALLQFNVDKHTFIGNTGCNSMEGKFTRNGAILSFSEQEVTTKNDCQGYNEEVFMTNLIKVNHFKIEDGVLELMVDQTIISKWVRKEPVGGTKAI